MNRKSPINKGSNDFEWENYTEIWDFPAMFDTGGFFPPYIPIFLYVGFQSHGGHPKSSKSSMEHDLVLKQPLQVTSGDPPMT